MKNNLVLIDDKGKYVVECLNGEFEFVHDKETGKNYFNQFVLSELFDINRKTVSYHLNKYLKNNTKNAKNIGINRIKLEIENSKRKQSFYDFNCVSYLAFRINTPEAIKIQNQISSILDTMFNVATGKTDLDTKLDKLKNMLEVEELKSDKYLQVYKELIKFDEELANETYHKYKVSKNNAFNCYELLMAKRDWDKRYNEVRDTIEPRTDGSKQLLLF